MSFLSFIISYWYIGLDILWVLWTIYTSGSILYWANVKNHDTARWYWHFKKYKYSGAITHSRGCIGLCLFIFGWLNIIVLILKFIF